ncbi:MAG: hypothetical protein AAGI03_09780 [Pseudomonadota bacterium]
MDPRRPSSPISRWREIVHPFFWPVFFWNLRRFAATLQKRIAAGGNGLISYEITWWGGIRIHVMIDPDPPSWDAPLDDCARRVHIAKLDIGNPHLTGCPLIAALAGIDEPIFGSESCTPSLLKGILPAPDLATLPAGTFPNLPHLDTS